MLPQDYFGIQVVLRVQAEFLESESDSAKEKYRQSILRIAALELHEKFSKGANLVQMEGR